MWRKGKLTRRQVIALAGLETVEKVDSENCDFTNRLLPEVSEEVEFAASVEFVDQEGNERSLTAYYYQDEKEVDEVESLDNLEWEIHGYEID